MSTTNERPNILDNDDFWGPISDETRSEIELHNGSLDAENEADASMYAPAAQEDICRKIVGVLPPLDPNQTVGSDASGLDPEFN